MVGVAETALNAIDRRFIRSPPPEDAFAAWAWAKTAIVMLLALAYGLLPELRQRLLQPIGPLVL